jgi:hypothetical protein
VVRIQFVIPTKAGIQLQPNNRIPAFAGLTISGAMQLVPHPDTMMAAIDSIDTTVWQDNGRWRFRYLFEGTADLVLPDPAEPGRADALWKTTCGEAFVGLTNGAYLEFNFSPSSQWAAYRFDAPREGMREEPAEVEVFLEGGESWVAIEAAVRCTALEPGLMLGMTAVVEERGGRKSYWALKHPDGPPNFHDRACFTALLANIAHE